MQKNIIIDGIDTGYIIDSNGTVFYKTRGKTPQYKVLKPHTNHRGYYLVNIYADKKMYAKQVHRLVAEAFIPNYSEEKTQVNHIDGDKSNNDISNLEWVSPKENIAHALSHGLIHNIGDTASSAKITCTIAADICKYLEDKSLSVPDIARICNVSIDTVRDIRRGKTWKHVSYKYNIHGKRKDGRGLAGENNPKAKISVVAVHEICTMISTGKYSLPQISRILSVPYRTIQHIYDRSSWKKVSKKYKFPKLGKGIFKQKDPFLVDPIFFDIYDYDD